VQQKVVCPFRFQQADAGREELGLALGCVVAHRRAGVLEAQPEFADAELACQKPWLERWEPERAVSEP
jgi:hypothetical protein